MLMIAGSNSDPLLSDDLAILLAQFPNDALQKLLGGMGKHMAGYQYDDRRAKEVRALPENSDLRPHASAIAEEVRWWASNAVHLAVGSSLSTWPEIVRDAARKAKVDLNGIADDAPAWKVEQALLAHLATKVKPLIDPGAGVAGAAVAAGGGAVALAEGAVAALLGRAAPAAVAAVPAVAALAPVVAVAGAAWAIYDFAGPSHRVLGPAVALIALTRQFLRDQRMAAAFRED